MARGGKTKKWKIKDQINKNLEPRMQENEITKEAITYIIQLLR